MKRKNSIPSVTNESLLMMCGYLDMFNAHYDTDLGAMTSDETIPRDVIQVSVPRYNLWSFLKFLNSTNFRIDIKKVIFNGPATIILWDDGTKTVVKCKEGDPYSKEAGFALCLLKKLAGNDFHKVLRNACDEKEKK